ncbi:MAG TPA: phosphate starvation-inducible protein PhoH [Clostridiales bacterium]|jgi:phosphate starvation-inducible protein PhoH and related proteins|nr:phosphate starvation-inducible protein PhoH [Clostridiales bacterium]
MTQSIPVTTESLLKLFGSLDENAIAVEKRLGVALRPRDGVLKIVGNDEVSVERAEGLIKSLLTLIGKGVELTRERVSAAIDLALMDKPDEIVALSTDAVAVTARGKYIRCRTLGQRAYVSAIRKNTLTFGIGPAGTGKTYLAVAMAVAAYKSGSVDKIILTRPAIEAGEKLGFLPGDLQTKVDPYLRPLYDALQELFGVDNYATLIERGIIEIAPLAYMRGRTLSNAFIILDEAQNATNEQMKMFLTRFGEGSKVVVNGDLTQVDLPKGVTGGLSRAVEILKGLEGVDVCVLTEKDVVRHELVQRIVLAYAAREKEDNGKKD